ncbi:MAG TPA: TetR/AcrR family transcriptional regulator [Candidatus Methylacidiphilales bacterium]
MARTKEFDEAEVLDRALEVFWEDGFQGASFATLTARLGVSRQSLYDTYGDKQALFLAAIRRYLDSGAEKLREATSAEGPIREVFTALLDGIIAGNCSCSPHGSGSRGCLATNTLIETAPEAEAARNLVLQHVRRVEGLLASRIAAAQRTGEVDPAKDPVALARFLYHTLTGIAVAARAGEDAANLRETARIALGALD